jgi:hypothetical protein
MYCTPSVHQNLCHTHHVLCVCCTPTAHSRTHGVKTMYCTSTVHYTHSTCTMSCVCSALTYAAPFCCPTLRSWAGGAPPQQHHACDWPDQKWAPRQRPLRHPPGMDELCEDVGCLFVVLGRFAQTQISF